MTEYLQNPRRSLRAPARCDASVTSMQGTFQATTEDVGGHGCQLISPRLLRKGEPVQLVISHEALDHPLRVAGRVAWASDQQPWRLGIAYDDSAQGPAKKWFDELLAQAPGLSAFRRIPERIPFDSSVYLAAPPRFLVDFGADEVALLRSVGSGTSVAELHALLRDRWPQAQRALFSLLAHQHVTLSRGGSVHPDAWRKILSEAEASLAVESLRGAPLPDPVRPAPPRSPAQAVSPAATAARPPAAAPPARPPAPGSAVPTEGDRASDWLVSAAEMMPVAWPGRASPAPATAGPPPNRGANRAVDEAGGWATAVPPAPPAGAATPPAAPAPPAAVAPARAGPAGNAQSRSAEAQECYRKGLQEMQAGQMGSAMVLLRRALTLAPGDPEIAGALGQAMRGGR